MQKQENSSTWDKCKPTAVLSLQETNRLATCTPESTTDVFQDVLNSKNVASVANIRNGYGPEEERELFRNLEEIKIDMYVVTETIHQEAE